MAAILQMTFSSSFSWITIAVFWLEFHWNLFPHVQLTISQYWFRLWLGTKQATSHYLNQWWPSLLMYLCVTQPQRVNLCHAALIYKTSKTYLHLTQFTTLRCSRWLNSCLVENKELLIQLSECHSCRQQSWQQKEPGHQQSRYWPNHPGIFHLNLLRPSDAYMRQ